MDRTTAKYLRRSAGSFERPLISDGLGGIKNVVVIPALAEEQHLFNTLDCLAVQPSDEIACTLVIIVVNNRCFPFAQDEEIADNHQTLLHLERMMLSTNKLRLGYVDASSAGYELGPKMGVGDARRIGLDHGLKVLVDNDEIRGLLISLDADSRVDSNYFAEIRGHFEISKMSAAVVAYAHRLDGTHGEIEAIVSYELFLRYHAAGLAWAGSPYAYPAIGSTMVCRADAYVAAGGMNRRQAAEDFYFLQQLQKTGGVDLIRQTRVRPSCRPSHRVPFGTGATIARLLKESVATYRIYNAGTYRILKLWLECVLARLGKPARELLEEVDALHPGLADHFNKRGFHEAWERLQQNSANDDQLRAQFHIWFDGFEALKLIHFLRDDGYPLQSLEEAYGDAGCLWSLETPSINWDDLDQRIELLEFLRAK